MEMSCETPGKKKTPAEAPAAKLDAPAGTGGKVISLGEFTTEEEEEIYQNLLRSKVDECRKWEEANPRCMRYMEDKCRELVRRGRHFSFKKVLEDARYHCTPDNGNEMFRLPNEYSPILARDLLRRVPGMGELVEVRRSKFDDVIGGSK
ncbi:MAG: hypothetical protein ACOYIK_04640 [Coriobacteriales bacterium]|jgi:hypothetical protein